MKIGEMFPSRYASGADLDGKPCTVTIAGVAAEKMRPGPGSPEAEKWVIYFKEGPRGFVFSRAMAKQIAELLGDDTEAWPGKRIVIYPEQVNMGGVQRIALRAKAAPAAPPPAAQPAKKEAAPAQAKSDPLAAVWPADAQVSYEMARTVKNRDGVLYMDLKPDQLKIMLELLKAALAAEDIDPDKIDGLQLKRDTLKVLLSLPTAETL